MAKKSTSTVNALSSIDLFAGLTKKELACIDRLTTPINIKAGKTIMKEGKPGREAFVITKGKASVWRNGKLIASLEKGALVGEMALLAGGPRTATIKAETDLDVEVLDAGEFSQLLDETPQVTRKLLTATIKRVRELEPSLLG